MPTHSCDSHGARDPKVEGKHIAAICLPRFLEHAALI
jgi:hypothetical protein